jgi:hypothetical protein
MTEYQVHARKTNFKTSYVLSLSKILKGRHNTSIVYPLIKGEFSQNTTSLEKMVYSAIETTCFGLYWLSSGFYNIEEESIKAVKTVRGC